MVKGLKGVQKFVGACDTAPTIPIDFERFHKKRILPTSIYRFAQDMGVTRDSHSASATVVNSRYWSNARFQVLLTKQFLENHLGFKADKLFKKFGFYTTQTRTGISTDLRNMRIRIAHTSVANLSENYVDFGSITHKYLVGSLASGLTFDDPSDLASWNDRYMFWDCNEEFKWNGEDNIVIEVSRTALDDTYFSIDDSGPLESRLGFLTPPTGSYISYRGERMDSGTAFPNWFTTASQWNDNRIVDFYIEIEV